MTGAGGANVDVNLFPKGDSKSQVMVQEGNLKDADDVARAKAYWADALGSLKRLLEG